MKPKSLCVEFMKNPVNINTNEPRISWQSEASDKGMTQLAYRILVSTNQDALRANHGDMWDSGRVESCESNCVIYKGKPLEPCKRYFFKVIVWDNHNRFGESEPSWWQMSLLEQDNWKSHWIALEPDIKRLETADIKKKGLPSPYFRKEFFVKAPVESAKIYASALGLYKLWVNGHEIRNGFFNPGWTDYRIRIQYQSFDITDFLTQGDNAIGSILGDGWYLGNLIDIGRFYYGEKFPMFIMQLHIKYIDGKEEIIVTDDTWKGSEGPILASDILMGEEYDARQDLGPWCCAGYDASAWSSIKVMDDKVKGKLVAHVGPYITIEKEIPPATIKMINKGTYIFDMGQNMVGWTRLKIRGQQSGDVITLRFAEVLNSDGTIYTENLRGAKSTDTYTCKGEDIEIYEQSFTYHGFRYVEITGLCEKPSEETITGLVVHSDTPLTGSFECSNPMVNQLYSNIIWGQRGNYFSIPTDCPQRDERLGWTGDSVNFVRTGLLNMDSNEFYHKYVIDMIDAQCENGSITDVAPQVNPFGNGNAGWGDAIIIVPWNMYLTYGDKQILEQSYDSMARWIHYLHENSEGYIRPPFVYGDWLNVNAETPSEIISTAYFAYSTNLMMKVSGVLNKKKEENIYRILFEKIKNAFCNKFILPEGKIMGDTQTGYVLALAMSLVQGENKRKCVQHLINNIKACNGHLSTGFVSIAFLLPVLCENGYADIAYQLINNDTYPSWGYSIRLGATTIWERWNSMTEDGLGDASMNSFNHYSLGSCGEWLYKYALGIQADELKPGFSQIRIKPYIHRSWSYAKGSYNSICGPIESAWEQKEDSLEMVISLPANTSGLIYIPLLKQGQCVYVDGELVESVKGIDIYSLEDGFLKLKVGSGKYHFSVR